MPVSSSLPAAATPTSAAPATTTGIRRAGIDAAPSVHPGVRREVAGIAIPRRGVPGIAAGIREARFRREVARSRPAVAGIHAGIGRAVASIAVVGLRRDVTGFRCDVVGFRCGVARIDPGIDIARLRRAVARLDDRIGRDVARIDVSRIDIARFAIGRFDVRGFDVARFRAA